MNNHEEAISNKHSFYDYAQLTTAFLNSGYCRFLKIASSESLVEKIKNDSRPQKTMTDPLRWVS